VERRLRRDAGLARCRLGLVVGPPPGPATIRDLMAAGCPLVRVWGPPASAGLAAAGPLDLGTPEAVGAPMAGIAVAVEADGDGRGGGPVLLRGDRVVDSGGDAWCPAGVTGRLDGAGRLHVVGADR
jgi:long-subunit acyl-CoA synthetase (AMP-forming)